MRWSGMVIAEGLTEPRLIDDLDVSGIAISEEGRAIDYHGGVGRWHTHWVEVSEPDIDAIQRHLRHGWYAHFWRGTDLLVVFDDARFSILRHDQTTWEPAREHGRRQGIPVDELDFLTDEAAEPGTVSNNQED